MYPISKRPATRILSAILLLASLEARAAQILSGKPDDTLQASVSRIEPTLIRVQGAHIRRVFGADGDFSVNPDPENGTAYLKPHTKKPFGIYLTDDSGNTWRLRLTVTDKPADSIVIQGKGIKANGQGPAGQDLARNQAIKEMLLALESDEPGTEGKPVNEAIPLWKEGRLVLVKEIEGSLLRGERYRLTNTSGKTLMIDERELYRRGTVAIAIEQPELEAGEGTTLYVIQEPRQ